jgi:hypothetical protein
MGRVGFPSSVLCSMLGAVQYEMARSIVDRFFLLYTLTGECDSAGDQVAPELASRSPCGYGQI